MLQNPHVLLTLDKVHNPLRLPRETSSERPNVVRTWCVLHILTSKWVSRHNSLHFFDMATSKRRFFDISTSKSGPDLVCFAHFAFKMCFAPHHGVQFFISHLARWLRTRRFSEPTFRPSGATNHWKNLVFRDFLQLLSSDSFSSLIFSLLLFSSL